MANLNEKDDWVDGIYQLEEDDPVLGGANGIDNRAPTQLAGRTRYLRLRGVSPWSAELEYPAAVAYVSHAGSTWKSVAASKRVTPGTDLTKWVRWAFTAAELKESLGEAVTAHEAKVDPHPMYAFRGPTIGVPQVNIGPVITVQTPHIRQMVWNGTSYVRAPWPQPGLVLYSYDNPASIPGYLPVRADLTYDQANYPDLAARLGLTGKGTFSLVELRGEFIRCLDNGRGVNKDRVLRSAEAGDNRSHAHGVTDPTHNHLVNDPTHGHNAWADSQGAHNHGMQVPANVSDTDRGSGLGSHFSMDSPKLINTDGAHGHNIGVGSAKTGIWLNASTTGIAIKEDGSEARPRNVAFPAWISY